MKRAEFEENSISEQQKIKMSLSCLSTLKSLCCSVWAEEWSVCAQTVTPAAEIIRESVKYPSLTLTTIMLWTHFKYVTINQEGHHSYLFFGNCDSKEMVITRYRAPTDFRPLRHIFVHFCGLPMAFMLHWQHYQVKRKCRQRPKWDSCFGNSQISLMV